MTTHILQFSETLNYFMDDFCLPVFFLFSLKLILWFLDFLVALCFSSFLSIWEDFHFLLSMHFKNYFLKNLHINFI